MMIEGTFTLQFCRHLALCDPWQDIASPIPERIRLERRYLEACEGLQSVLACLKRVFKLL